MAERSEISWTHATFNPWWGCVKVSEACKHCYAETFDHRLGGDHWGPTARRRFFGEKHWQEPLKWNERAAAAGERRRVFCASMADVFETLPQGHPDEAAMEEARRRLWALIEATPSLDWLLLTKRPQSVEFLAPWRENWPPHVWLGTTVENRQAAYDRVWRLALIPARVRFLSCEPLLEDISVALEGICISVPWAGGESRGGRDYSLAVGFIHQIIAGGESGHGARPTHPAWLVALRDLCRRHRIAFHFKQWGAWAPGMTEQIRAATTSVMVGADGAVNGQPPGAELLDFCRAHKGSLPMYSVGAKAAGRILEGRTWDEFPEARP